MSAPINLLTKFLFVRDKAIPMHLSGPELGCLIHIVDDYNAGLGRSWPSHDKLAKRTGYSLSTVRRSVAGLVRVGIVTKDSGWTGRSNRYLVDFRPCSTGEQGSTGEPCSTGEQAACSTVEQAACSTGEPLYTYPPRSFSVGEEEVSPLRGAPGGFEEFWRAYPKREGRARAKEKFAEVVAGGVTVETLVAGAQRYALAKADVDPKWVKLPFNWLADECWLEDPQPLRRPVKEKSPRAAKKAAAHKAKTADVIKFKPKVKPKPKAPPAMSMYEHAATSVCADKPKPEPKRPFKLFSDVHHVNGERCRVVGYGDGCVRVKWWGNGWDKPCGNTCDVPIGDLSTEPPPPKLPPGFVEGASVWDRGGAQGTITGINNDGSLAVLDSQGHPIRISMEAIAGLSLTRPPLPTLPPSFVEGAAIWDRHHSQRTIVRIDAKSVIMRDARGNVFHVAAEHAIANFVATREEWMEKFR